MKVIKYLSILFAVLYILACNNEDIDPSEVAPAIAPEQVVLKKEVKFIDETDFQDLVEVDVDGSVYVFHDDSPMASELEEGDIMFVSLHDTLTYYRLVTAIDKNNSQITLETRGITPFDLFETYDFTIQIPVSNDLLRSNCTVGAEQIIGSSCTVELCANLTNAQMMLELRFVQDADLLPKLELLFGNIEMEITEEMRCENFAIEMVQLDFIALKKLIKDGIKFISKISTQGGILQVVQDEVLGTQNIVKIEEDKEEDVEKSIIETIIKSIDVGAGVVVKDLFIEGSMDYKYKQTIGGSVSLEAGFQTDVWSLLTNDLIGVRPVSNFELKNSEALEEFKIGCSGHVDVGIFFSMEIQTPKIEIEYPVFGNYVKKITLVDKFQLLDLRVELGGKVNASPKNGNQTALDVTVKPYYKLRDYSFNMNAGFETEELISGYAYRNTIDIDCRGMSYAFPHNGLTQPTSTIPGSINLSVEGPDNKSYELFFDFGTGYVSQGVFQYNQTIAHEFDMSLFNFLIQDLEFEKCRIEQDVSVIIEDEPEDPDPIPGSDSDICLFAKTSIIDDDGNRYCVVEIDGKDWLASNMRKVTSDSEDVPGSDTYFGRLYTFEEAQTICPQGWHLPSKNEWESMFRNLEDSGDNNGSDAYSIGGDIRSPYGWENYNGVQESNSTRFGVYPAGAFEIWNDEIHEKGRNAHFWTSTDLEGSEHSSYSVKMSYNSDVVEIVPSVRNAFKYSCRCVRN